MDIFGLVAGFIFFIGLAFAKTEVVFYSDAGDWVGGGQNFTFASGITVSTSGGSLTVNIQDNSHWFTLVFDVPDYVKTFGVGNYGNAERAEFRSPMRPGIDIYGDGRGCNTDRGWFRVLEANFGNDSSILHLAINLKQNCEGGTPALYGAVRINSSLPINLNAPVAIAGPPTETIEGSNFSLNGNQSFKRGGEELKFNWSQQLGPPVQLRGSTSAQLRFTAPVGIPLGGTVLLFRLEVTDADNNTDSDTIRVKVHSKSDRQYYVDFTSQPGDYIGGGQNYHFDQSNTEFFFSGSESGAFLTLGSSDNWYIAMVPASGNNLEVGKYVGAQRYPFQSAGNPGLSVYGAGRGCNTLTGNFTVKQEETDSNGDIIAFGAKFEQHCEGAIPALLGIIRYNYLDSHVPTAVAGPSQIATAGETVMLDGSGSTDPKKNVLSYQWSQTQGPNVMLNNYNSSKPTFVAPTVASSKHLLFSLLVINNLGYMSSAVTLVTVNLAFP